MAAGSVAGAQQSPESDNGPAAGPVVPDDLDEVSEALRTLDAAQVPPTAAELTRFLAEANRDTLAAAASGSSWDLNGSVLVRSGYYRREGLDSYGKIAFQSRGLHGRARFRQYRSGLREVNGAFMVAGDPLEVRVGNLGLVHGFGLLLAAPGRGLSLGADTGLGPRPERLVTWLGTPDARAVAGVGVKVGVGTWHLRYVGGRQMAPGAGKSLPRKLHALQLGFRQNGWGLTAAGVTANGSQGLSLTGGWRRGAFAGHFETLLWRARPDLPWVGAAMVHLRWKSGSLAGLEGQCSLADLAQTPALAGRPPGLPGWSGRGVVIRGFIRAADRLEVRGLVHLGAHLDRAGVRNRIDKALVDVQVHKRWLPGIEAAIRYRSTGNRHWSWSERYPWLPPEAGPRRRRTIFSARVAGEWSALRTALLIRTYGRDGDPGAGRRSLWQLSTRYRWGACWIWRGVWASAWGEPVDLVSALVPLTGMVLPRHWGRWRAETVMSAEWRRERTRVQAAASYRQNTLGPTGQDQWTVWWEAGVRW
jgi:hypothetical protein